MNSSVPSQPNAALIRGKLINRKPEPDGRGTVIEVLVDETDDVDGLANYARSEIGQVVSVFLHPELNLNVDAGDSIRIKVGYRGDERSGRFVALDTQIDE